MTDEQLAAIKKRQKDFACFCYSTEHPDLGAHHPECMSSAINQDVRDLLREVEDLTRRLSAFRFNLDRKNHSYTDIISDGGMDPRNRGY
jgi:hypothetical protein